MKEITLKSHIKQPPPSAANGPTAANRNQMKTNYENITPFTRWITNVEDYNEEISRFEEKAAKIVNKYYEKMRSEILEEIQVLNKETDIEWNCWIDTMDDISVLDYEGEFKELIRRASLKAILEEANQE